MGLHGIVVRDPSRRWRDRFGPAGCRRHRRVDLPARVVAGWCAAFRLGSQRLVELISLARRTGRAAPYDGSRVWSAAVGFWNDNIWIRIGRPDCLYLRY